MKFSGLDLTNMLHSSRSCTDVNNYMGTNLSSLLSRNQWVSSESLIESQKYANFECKTQSVENLSTSIGISISQSYLDKNLVPPSRGILKKSFSCTESSCKTDDLKSKDNFPNITYKSVSFADDNNLNLFEIRSYVLSSERLDFCDSSDDERKNKRIIFENSSLPSARSPANPVITNKVFKKKKIELVACFENHAQTDDIFQYVSKHNVALEKCLIRGRTITGIIITKNIDYHKEIFVRYTINKWESFNDVEATYVPKSSDGGTDRFMFSVSLPQGFPDLVFAIRYKVANNEYWDNNNGLNYRVRDIMFE
ncbi:protein phosphatase 1 regulatory subunit 3B [Hydra vulgaris]|uniref:Protein phosphatase 1 regulatory subunit 3B n=1 Tax=Hydra vulgaris TaxID=6087 RepID=A0ABM4C1R2_HYDVU